MSERTYDINGFYEVRDNPISKVGVFPYLGAQIDPSGEKGLLPDKIYSVYRPAEELSNQETIDSFKLQPWIDDHEMLGGGGDSLTPPEEKGVHGVLGEQIYFKDGTLFSNLKMWSQGHSATVDAGKKELSCGFRCEYDVESGIFGDQAYDIVQRKILGNHIASVDAGRMGPDVAVMDHKLIFTVDSKDFILMAEKDDKDETGMDSAIKAGFDAMNVRFDAMDEKIAAMAADAEPDDDKAEDADPDDDKAEDAEPDDDKAEDMGDHPDGEDEDLEESKKKAEGMDAAMVRRLGKKVVTLDSEIRDLKRDGVKGVMRELRKREALYEKVSARVGVFDHDDMTIHEVAVYACDQLKLPNVPKGHELTAVETYLSAAPVQRGFALDSAAPGADSAPSAVGDWLSGAKN